MSDEKRVGYVAQFSAAISQDGMNLSFSFNMPEGATPGQFGEKIDTLRAVVMRQRAQGEVKILSATLAEKEGHLRNFKLDLAQYLKGHSADDDHAERTRARIEELQADIERGKRELQATRALAV